MCKNAIIKELLFYQKTAAFHMSTVIGLSPEELITRSYVMKQAALEAASELEKSGKNYAISNIVHSSVSIIATGFEILGYALSGPTFGAGLFFAAIGNLLSLSSDAVQRINGFSSGHNINKQDAQEVLGEIQRSVLTGGFALASFLDDYVEVIQRFDTFKKSAEGQQELQKMEEDADILAKEMAYTDFNALSDALQLHGSGLWTVKSQIEKAIPLIEYSIYKDFDATVAYEKFTKIDLGASSQLFTKGAWMFSIGKGTFDIIRNALRLGKDQLDTPIGEAIRDNVEFLDQAIPEMYAKISELVGDAEDLMSLEAAVEELGALIDIHDDNEWRTLEDKGNGDMENEVYGTLYNVMWDQ